MVECLHLHKLTMMFLGRIDYGSESFRAVSDRQDPASGKISAIKMAD